MKKTEEKSQNFLFAFSLSPSRNKCTPPQVSHANLSLSRKAFEEEEEALLFSLAFVRLSFRVFLAQKRERERERSFFFDRNEIHLYHL
jgi:hypothetical protein